MSQIGSAELPGNRIRPIIALRWAVRLGLIAALVFALSATTTQFNIFRKCQGAFGRGFSDGFDRYRCNLLFRHIGTDFRMNVPLP
jgi:hypothetical protein